MNDKLAKATDSASIFALMGSAVERLGGEGAKDAASAIETLVRLKREEDDRSARREFFTALNEFHRTCPPIPKDKKSEQTSRNGGTRVIPYADLATIEKIVRPILVPLGFSWRWDTLPAEHGHVTIRCYLMHLGGHQEHADMALSGDLNAPMNAAQMSGAVRTYGMRYSLEQVLGLVTTKDTDGADPDGGDGLEPIEEDQQAEIEHLLKESGRSREKFLAWMRVASVAAIQRRDYKRAADMLRQAIKAGSK